MNGGEIINTSIEYLKGVGPQRAESLKNELSIFDFNNLLQHFPFRYIDRTQFYKVNEIGQDSQYIQLKGIISGIKISGIKRQKRLTAVLKDDTGSIGLIWFQGIKWIKDSLIEGAEFVVFGKPSKYKGSWNIAHPETEPLKTHQQKSLAKLQPVYPSTEKLKLKGLDSRGIHKLITNLFEKLNPEDFPENLPLPVMKKYRLTSRWDSMRLIHRPNNGEEKNEAERRIKFEELLMLQMGILKLRLNRLTAYPGFLFPELGPFFNKFYHNGLEFELTSAQKRVLKEIRKDTLSGKQMNRLLQGDVGSGKTIVAFLTILMAIDNGYQACLMAPTEILTQQHYRTLSDYSEKSGVSIALLTGSTKTADRKEMLEKLKEGSLNILTGTHALIEDRVKFKDLGLVIIDEQHRFGVAQRAKLHSKSETNPPHVLVMTATPIPRTLAMTLYGDLDVSVIDELPPGRKPIKTVHYYDSDRLKIFGFIEEQIKMGGQVYVVYPLIQESEKLDYKDLEDGYNSMQRAFPLPKYKLGILHGRMTPEAKEFEMDRYVKGKTDILVSTTVIEVGVDVPNATAMIIESAERFGLSQLHQLRGRVGRGKEKSYCILVTDYKLSSDARTRMKTMTATNDGFRIAEVDMNIRGPGIIEGTRQSGRLNLKLADLTTDYAILQEARKTAVGILEKDPTLQLSENRGLKRYLSQKNSAGKQWSKIL